MQRLASNSNRWLLIAGVPVTPARWQRTARALVLPVALSLVVAFSAGCERAPPLTAGAERADADEADITAQMITAIEAISRKQAESGLVRRVNQAKSLGCFRGQFTVPQALEPELKEGLFARQGRYAAVLRFANASTDDDRDQDFRGVSISLQNVAGAPAWGEQGRQDFLLNSYPALFAANPREFLAFLRASAAGARWKFFVNPANWDSVAILLRGRQQVADPFAINYWSTTPYRFGEDPTVAVKYKLSPCDKQLSAMPEDPGQDFLREAMQARLRGGDACFDFAVQFQQDPKSMPIEDASVIWDEQNSPFRNVAKVTIPRQQFTSAAALAECEQAAFNPWHALEAHRPLGGINRVRRAVYAESSALRRQLNTNK